MRYGAKIDANQPQIVAALRKAGCTVQHLHAVGEGCPDLLCAVSGVAFLIEVKDGAKIPSKQALTPAQAKWHAAWNSDVHVVNSVDGALAVAQLYKSRRLPVAQPQGEPLGVALTAVQQQLTRAS